MDLEKLEYYEFLDLSDIDEHERQQLKQTLFSEGTLDFLQLPWTNQITSAEWPKENYGSESTSVPNGPSEPSSSPHGAQVGPDQGDTPMAPPMQPVTLYSPPALPAYTMPPPSTGYQHPQNVFVTNVTANVHGAMPGHYVQQHYGMPEQTEMPGRGHRGRGRNRGNKRNECRMESTLVETTSTQPYAPQYVPMYYHHAYYTQPMGSPIQHPNPQHAPASPLYITSMYTPMYGAYHTPGPQYYPPPTAHVNTVLEETPDISEINLEQNAQEEPVYQHQISEADYDTSQNVVTSVIINSNIDTSHSEIKSSNSPFLSNNHVKVNDHVISDTCSIKSMANSVSPKSAINSPSVINIVKNEPILTKISANVNDVGDSSEVLGNASINSVTQHVAVYESDAITYVPKIVSSQLQAAAVIESAAIHKTVPVEPKINKVVAPTLSDSTSVTDVLQDQIQVLPATNKSWASLFSNKSCNTNQNHSFNDVISSPKPLVSELLKGEEEKQSGNSQTKLDSAHKSIYTNDPVSHRMGEFLSKYTLDNRTVSLQPRGLTNRSNYCYINSILQALLACPPFYNLLKALPHQTRKNITGKSPTPIIDSMVEFVNEFMPLSAGARLNRKEKGQRKDDNIDVPCGTAFEPSWIYKILNGIRSDTFIVEGRQEDAEEFFGCLLNGLNDEMLELMKLTDRDTQNNNKSLSNGDIVSNGDTNDQEDEWKVMGPKNKGSVTRRTDFDRSPISDIFRGQLRSRVHRTNSRSQDQVTDNVQPFFTLQLDIEKTNSVNEALEALVHKDKLEGVTCSKTNQQVEAWQQVTVEELPLVMVLHLKCFNYKLDACSKIIKALEFPIDLKIDSKLLSAKIKYTAKQKQYKLFAVVYHDGKEASKGHYLTDAYHVGYGGWVRYDDSTVKSVNEAYVLHPGAARVPYLLFYRRCDTIGNQLNNKKD